jgi:hypothetical protein
MLKWVREVPPYKLIFGVELLISGIEVFKSSQDNLSIITIALAKLVLEYPDPLIYWICPLKYFSPEFKKY